MASTDSFTLQLVTPGGSFKMFINTSKRNAERKIVKLEDHIGKSLL